jgi:hypothetical protein
LFCELASSVFGGVASIGLDVADEIENSLAFPNVTEALSGSEQGLDRVNTYRIVRLGKRNAYNLAAVLLACCED